MLDVEELIDNMTKGFVTRDPEPFTYRDRLDEPTLDFWEDDEDEQDSFWTYKNVNPKVVEQPFVRETRTIEEIPAAERALIQHGKAPMTTGDFALKMLARKGAEYEWGGTTRKTGFDCSGIIQTIMQNNGFENFPRVSGDIYAHSKKISLKKAINTRGAILWKEGHIAVSLGNGKTIEAMGEEYGVVIGDAHGRFTHGGILPETALGKTKGVRKKITRLRTQAKPRKAEVKAVDPVSQVTPFTSFDTELPMLVLDVADEAIGTKLRDQKDSLSLNKVEKQMRRGFLDAGRPDLARMVGTKAFDTWVQQESGWERDATSPPNNQGLANDGFFQVWRGHAFNANGEVADMSAREQARLIATHFDLSAQDIRDYAKAIRRGEYLGWG